MLGLTVTMCIASKESCADLRIQERLSETHPLVNEAITDYARAMNKISFDHAAKTRSSGVAGLAMVPLDSAVQNTKARQVRLKPLVSWLLVMLHKISSYFLTW